MVQDLGLVVVVAEAVIVDGVSSVVVDPDVDLVVVATRGG